MVNKVILIGNLGNDPEVRYLDGGVAVANFRIATTESYKNKNGERVEQTEWHNIVLWRGQAEFAEKYIKKGMKVYLEGRLRTRSWEDQTKGTLYRTEIWGDSIQILTPKANGGEPYHNDTPSAKTENKSANSAPAPIAPAEDTDDLPF